MRFSYDGVDWEYINPAVFHVVLDISLVDSIASP